MTTLRPLAALVTPLSRLRRRVEAAQTYALCCTASRGAASTEAACSDCEALEDDAARILSEVVAAEPGSALAIEARVLADMVGEYAAICRASVATFRARARRAVAL